MNNLTVKAYELRQDVLDIVTKAQGGHIGGDMSVMDILVTLYFHEMNIDPRNSKDPNRDRFVLSKGHSMESLYAVLAAKGFLNLSEILKEIGTFGTKYIGHPNNKLPGIEMNSGSLGHGLPVSVGMALAGRMDNRSYRVYTVMGDGELAEGSIWEGAMAAAHYKLDNLCAVIDWNGLQISGTVDQVMEHKDMVGQWESFGWNVLCVNGNDITQLIRAFDKAKSVIGKPTVILAKTIKGFGSALMEGKIDWHHKVPTPLEYVQIKEELHQRKEATYLE